MSCHTTVLEEELSIFVAMPTAAHLDSESATSLGTSHVTSFFKTVSVPLVAKQQITHKVVEMVSKDLRPFEIIAGDGFIEHAQAHRLELNMVRCPPVTYYLLWIHYC